MHVQKLLRAVKQGLKNRIWPHLDLGPEARNGFVPGPRDWKTKQFKLLKIKLPSGPIALLVSTRLAELVKPREEVAMENAVKFLMIFRCSSFLRKRSSKISRFDHDNFPPFCNKGFAAANAQIRGVFHSADVCP